MEFNKHKTKIYLLLLSLIMGLISWGVIKNCCAPASDAEKQQMREQALKGLEKTAAKNPAVSNYLQGENDAREATDEAGK